MFFSSRTSGMLYVRYFAFSWHLWETTLRQHCVISPLQESIEERLGALDIDVSKVKTPGGLPQTDSFAVLLVQGLESNDAEILNVSLASSVCAVQSVHWDWWGASLKAGKADQFRACCFSSCFLLICCWRQCCYELVLLFFCYLPCFLSQSLIFEALCLW